MGSGIYRTLVSLGLLLCFDSNLPAVIRNIDSTVIDVIKRTDIDRGNISIILYDLKSKKTKYSLNADKLFSIASLNKLFITGAAIKYLGQDFRFKTIVAGDLPNSSGIINNDIYIKGTGDPLFVSESMWFLVNKLVNMGVKNIKGDIILDDSLFPAENIYSNANDRAYSAKVSSLSVNFNSVAVNVISGHNPRIVLDPPVSNIKLVNNTKPASKKTNVIIKRENDDIVISGRVNKSNYSSKIFYRNITDPIKYFTDVLKLHLKWRNIAFSGSVLRGILPDNKTTFFEIESRRLSDILSDMNRFSSNFISEQIVRAISAEDAASIIRRYLMETGLSNLDFETVNASGFSKANKAKPKAIIKFLNYMYFNFLEYPEFISSLSIAGMDGTIKDTIKEKSLKGKVRAKTGTLRGIRGLAGYLYNKHNVYAFVIIANDVNAGKLTSWEGRILKSFIKN